MDKKSGRATSRLDSSGKSSKFKNYNDTLKLKQQRQAERGILKPPSNRDYALVTDPNSHETIEQRRDNIRSESSIGVDTEGLMQTAEEIAQDIQKTESQQLSVIHTSADE